MNTIAAPATAPAEMLMKVNGCVRVKAYVESYNNAIYVSRHESGRGFVIRATSFAMKYICERAGFQAVPLEVHDAVYGDATWHLSRPAGATQFV